jgi:diguanylate cyclase (GGDEF)-like protein
MNLDKHAPPYGSSVLSVELLCGLLNSLEEGIILLDSEGRVLHWNVWMVNASGISQPQSAGRNLVEIFPELATTRVPGAVEWALKRNLPSFLSPSLNPSPFPLGRKDQFIDQSIRITPLVLGSGEIFCMVHIMDVSAMVEKDRILRQRARQLRELSRIDPMTGVANRRRFQEHFETEVRRHRRNDAKLSLIILDVDFFKLYNDTYGHRSGDDCLVRVSTAIGFALHRAGDLLARVGGEEFAVLLPDTDEEGATTLAEQIRAAIEAEAIPHIASTVARVVTASLGVVTAVVGERLDYNDLYTAADISLYEAKSAGRNTWRNVVLGM